MALGLCATKKRRELEKKTANKCNTWSKMGWLEEKNWYHTASRYEQRRELEKKTANVILGQRWDGLKKKKWYHTRYEQGRKLEKKTGNVILGQIDGTRRKNKKRYHTWVARRRGGGRARQGGRERRRVS